MYILVYIFLLLVAITKNSRWKCNDKIYLISITILWLMLAFRYGQGTDYFAYQYIYNIAQRGYVAYNLSIATKEIGMFFLCNILKCGFEVFVLIISTFEMVMLNRFIKKYSDNYSLTLLLFYPTFYLTYYFSSIRQGIVLALFLGVMLEKLEKEKFVQYILLCFLACTIHMVALVLLLCPIIIKLSEKIVDKAMIVCLVVGGTMALGIGRSFLIKIPFVGLRLANYIDGAYISIPALLFRICMYICILVLYKRCQRQGVEKRICNWMKLYSMGMGIYFLFLPFPLISARLSVMFEVLQVVLIPYLVKIKTRYRQMIYFCVLLLTAVMVVKNISSYIEQGEYYNDVNIFTYPYISIFNKDTLWEYREPSRYYSLEL